MKRLLYLSIGISLFILQAAAQGTGSWKSYMAYYTTTAVAEADNNVFAVANNSLYSYNKDDESYKTYSKVNDGLSDMQIDSIAYHPEMKTLLITYTNGNIDMLTENGIHNIPYLMQSNVTDKEIYHIYFQGKLAYISGAYGIMVLDMDRKEIKDTYRLGYAVYSVTIFNDYIYAATSSGIRYSRLDNNLLDPNNWDPYTIEYTDNTDGQVNRIVVFQDRLFVLLPDQGIYIQQNNTQFEPFYKNENLKNLSVQNNKLISYTTNNAQVWFSLSEYHTINTGTLYGISTLKNENNYWVASGSEMLRGVRRKGSTSDYEWFVSGIRIDSPKRDMAAFMTFQHGKLWIAGGGRWAYPYYRPGTIMVYDKNSETNQWYNFDEAKIVNQSPGKHFNDVTSIAIDPQDETHFFASTWGDGVFEFKENELTNVYYTNNSRLQSLSDKVYTDIRVDGLTFDKQGKLWMTNSQVNRGIVTMDADGAWNSLSFNSLSGQYLVDKILITANNHKWVNVLRGVGSGSTGILVFDDTSDKPAQFYSTFRTSLGGSINANTYYCMAEDLEGQIWIGTNLGPIYCANPSNALNNRDSFTTSRIIRKNEYGEDTYFMDGESVRAIAVDGGNRKWLGTQSSGVLLISPDGLETIEHFTTENSPLPSNYIESLAIDHETGEVFIGTDKGIVSYMGSATTGHESYSDVYAYPNPVRPDYQGEVTITGLMADSNVKITDINGNLIKQGKSLGGQFVWNCRKSNGERVSTGIYLVMAYEPNKGESVVTKIMVIK